MVHGVEHGVRQIQAEQRRRRRPAGFGRVIGIGDGTAALPGAFPKGAVRPVAAGVVVARQAVVRHQVGAEQEAIRPAQQQPAHRLAVGRNLAHLPLCRAGVEIKGSIALQQLFEVIGVLGVAPHVGGDPGQVGEHLQHPNQSDVLIGLGPELAHIGIRRAKPGIRVGDVDHDDADAGGAGAAGRLDPPGGVHEQAAFASARRRPELDDIDALFQIAVEEAVGLVVRSVERLLADGSVEAQPVAEARHSAGISSGGHME